MFKYIWIMIIIGLYLLWGYRSVKDCIEVFNRHSYDDIVDFLDELDPCSAGFIVLTLLIVVGASFFAWLMSLFAE